MALNLLTPTAAIIVIILVLVFSIKAQTRGAQVKFYVAPDGNDAWSGRLPAPNAAGTDGPFATLTRARDGIRELKATSGLQQPVNVLIRGGTYYLSEPLSLGPQDSGTEQYPIVYQAYQGEKPVLCGGKIITGWKPYKDGIMQCSLAEVKEGNWKFRQLFFDGERQPRACWPNPDPDDPLYTGWAFIEETLPKGEEFPTTFRYEPDPAPQRWAKPTQAEVVIFPWFCWVNDLIPIKEVDHDRRVITVDRQGQPPFANAVLGTLVVGNRFRVENVLEELDRPGEWCLDTQTGTLYFWPPTGLVQDGEVIAPVTDRLIELIGTPKKPVGYVQISGLTLMQTLSPFPEQRHPNFHAPTFRGEALRLENTEYCRIADNLVVNVGGDGVRLQGACASNWIVDNEIAYAGGQGVSMSSADIEGNQYLGRDLERLREQSVVKPRMVRNVISNNHIHHYGQIEKHAAGLLIWGINSVENVISHNLVHHGPHAGLTAQDGFGRLIIEYNEMHDLCLEIADCGGIFTNRWYTLRDDEDLAPGNVIRYNLIRDVIGCAAYGEPQSHAVEGAKAYGKLWTPYYVWAMYFDNSGMDVTVCSNICVGNTMGGISFLSDPRDNLVENNLFIESSVQQMYLEMRGDGNRFLRNIVYYVNPEAALLRTRGGEGVAECDYNLYWQAGGHELIVRGVPEDSFAKWQEMGFDTHSVVADPLFVDPENGDYRLQPNSPAFALGFEPIPVEHIGLQRK